MTRSPIFSGNFKQPLNNFLETFEALFLSSGNLASIIFEMLSKFKISS